MKRLFYIVLAVAALSVAGCQKNYYSGNGKNSSKHCGCPGSRGL